MLILERSTPVFLLDRFRLTALMLALADPDQATHAELIHAITSHASQFSTDVSELGRFRGEADERVAQGRALVDQVNRVRAGDEQDLLSLRTLYSRMHEIDYHLVAIAFSRLFFDRMADILDVLRANLSAHDEIKRAAGLIDVLSQPEFTAVRLELRRRSTHASREAAVSVRSELGLIGPDHSA